MKSRKILATEVVIKTAAVEIKTLTLKGKQMTLAVFRQLYEEELIDPTTGQLRGVPWGRVHYFWGDCKADHLHVVWQLGEELRRSCVYAQPGEWPLWTKLSKRLKTWCLLRALEGWEPQWARKITYREYGVNFTHTHLDTKFDINFSNDEAGVWPTFLGAHPRYLPETEEEKAQRVESGRRAILKQVPLLGGTVMPAQAYYDQEVSPLLRAHGEYQKARQESYAACAQADHLFIAA